MSLGFWMTVIVIFIISLAITSYVSIFRKKISCSVGMMIAMTMGMMVGIVGGTIIGIFYSGDLFMSTLFSSFLGIFVGLIGGLPIGLMAILDGMISGLMGGMMGAMLGDMITSNHADTLIKILLVIFVIIMIILFYMMLGEINQGKRPKFIRNPFFMAIIIIAFFFIYNQFGNIAPTNHQLKMNNHIHQQ